MILFQCFVCSGQWLPSSLLFCCLSLSSLLLHPLIFYPSSTLRNPKMDFFFFAEMLLWSKYSERFLGTFRFLCDASGLDLQEAAESLEWVQAWSLAGTGGHTRLPETSLCCPVAQSFSTTLDGSPVLSQQLALAIQGHWFCLVAKTESGSWLFCWD